MDFGEHACTTRCPLLQRFQTLIDLQANQHVTYAKKFKNSKIRRLPLLLVMLVFGTSLCNISGNYHAPKKLILNNMAGKTKGKTAAKAAKKDKTKPAALKVKAPKADTVIVPKEAQMAMETEKESLHLDQFMPPLVTPTNQADQSDTESTGGIEGFEDAIETMTDEAIPMATMETPTAVEAPPEDRPFQLATSHQKPPPPITTPAPTNLETVKGSRLSFSETDNVRTFDASTSPTQRSNVAFCSLICKTGKIPASKRLKAMTSMLKYHMGLGKQLDERLIYYEYNDTPKEDIKLEQCIFAPDDDSFPTTMSNMKKFFQGLDIRERETVYLRIKIGFDGNEPHEFVQDFNALLSECQNKDVEYTYNANIYYAPIQTPFTESCGWLVGYSGKSNAKEFHQGFNLALNALSAQEYERQNKPPGDPIEVAVSMKFIRDGKSFGSKKSSGSRDMEDVKRALHFEVKKGTAKRTGRLIRVLIKKAPYVLKRSNIPLTWCPTINKDSSLSDIAYNNKCMAHHKSVALSCETMISKDIESLDTPFERLQYRTLREILLKIESPRDEKGQPTGRMFLQVETTWTGDTIFIFAKKWAVEARETVKLLLPLLRHEFKTDAIDLSFTAEAIEEADDYYWDDTTNRPVSKLNAELNQGLTEAQKGVASWIMEGIQDMLPNETTDTTKRPERNKHWEDSSFQSRATATDRTAVAQGLDEAAAAQSTVAARDACPKNAVDTDTETSSNGVSVN